MENKRWTDQEIGILRQYYPDEGGKTIERLPGRNKTSIWVMAHKLGVRHYSPQWSLKELEILNRYYPIEGTKVAKRLLGRTKGTIMTMAQKLEIRHDPPRWSSKEIDILKQYYPLEGRAAARHLPGRTENAIGSQASLRGLQHYSRQGRDSKEATIKLGLQHGKKWWSREEIAILKRYYPLEGLTVAERLPNRTRQAVGHKAVRLGITCKRRFSVEEPDAFWTEEEIEVLKNHFPLEGVKVANRLPGRTGSSIDHKAMRLGIKKVWRYEHRVRNGVEEKQCSQCNQWKSLSEFHECRKHQDGLQNTCKKCRTDYYYDNREDRRAYLREHYIANCEAIKTRVRHYYSTHREECLTRAKQYQEVHKAEISIRNMEYYKEHTEEIKAKTKAWSKTPKGKAASQFQKARRRLVQQTGDLTLQEWEALIGQYPTCAYCGHPFDNDKHRLSMDHIVPLSRGGPHTQSNVLPVCFACNSRKHTSLLGEEWLPWDLYDEQGQLIRSS